MLYGIAPVSLVTVTDASANNVPSIDPNSI